MIKRSIFHTIFIASTLTSLPLEVLSAENSVFEQDSFAIAIENTCFYSFKKGDLESKECKQDDYSLRIDNYKDGIGRIYGNLGTENLHILTVSNAIHFLEITTTGNMRILTVFNEWNEEKGGFLCVYTRTTDWAGVAQSHSTGWGFAYPRPYYMFPSDEP